MSELKDMLINISEEVRTKVIPENIKAGVQIFDTEGEYTGIDTSDATATAGDIAKDKTAYVDGEKITGTMESMGDFNTMIDITGATAITDGLVHYITKVGELDFKDVTSTGYLFRAWTGLKEAPKLKNTNNILYWGYMFTGCSALETVPVYDVTNLKHMNSAFQSCPNLSNESLNNIMQMCINAVNYDTYHAKTLRQIGLTSSQATVCQSLSNYQAFLNAGWTTGY